MEPLPSFSNLVGVVLHLALVHPFLHITQFNHVWSQLLSREELSHLKSLVLTSWPQLKNSRHVARQGSGLVDALKWFSTPHQFSLVFFISTIQLTATPLILSPSKFWKTRSHIHIDSWSWPRIRRQAKFPEWRYLGSPRSVHVLEPWAHSNCCNFCGNKYHRSWIHLDIFSHIHRTSCPRCKNTSGLQRSN